MIDHLPTVLYSPALRLSDAQGIPALFAAAGEQGTRRFFEFFTANIRNRNTRIAYARAVSRFAGWCENHGFRLDDLTPLHVAAYIERLGQTLSKPSVKQHLAAVRTLFDYLVVGQVVKANPASSVRGPKYVIKKGKTPALSAEEARCLLERIDLTTVAGLRDRALIGVMVYSFARVGAVIGMNVEDYYQQGRRMWLRLHEKGGKHHEVPAHHKAEEYMDAYVQAAGIEGQRGSPLFRTLNRRRQLTPDRMERREVLAMVKRRAKAADLGEGVCCHSFRATGITVYLERGGTLERAQAIAAHESPRTTKLYDRTCDQITLDEIEKIQI